MPLTFDQKPIVAKAERLVADERVRVLPDASVYWIAGDHGEYVVVLQEPRFGAPAAYCSCPASKTCSHILAAQTLWRRGRVSDPFAGIPSE